MNAAVRVTIAAAAALAAASAATAAAPIVGIEVAASSANIGPSVGHADAPAAATNGRTTLVVWQDDRGAFDHVTTHIYGAFVRPDGSLIQKTDFPIATAPGTQVAPAVTWTGTNYVVVWQDSRNGNADIYGARVSAQGAVLDPAGVPIATGAQDQATPAVASDGRESLVTWSQHATSSGWDIAGQLVDASLHVVRGASPRIAATNGDEVTPAVSYGGSLQAAPTGSFLVTWEQVAQGDRGDIYAARVTPAGRKLDAAAIPLATSSGGDYGPKVVWDTATPQWLAVWGYRQPPGIEAVIGKRISPQGAPLDRSPIQITYNAAAPGGTARNPTVVSTGRSGYLVLYNRNVDLGPAEVDATAVTLSGQTKPKSELAGNLGDGTVTPAAAEAGAHAYLTFANGGEVWGAPVPLSDPAGVTVRPLAQSANPQQSPAIAWNGSEYLVAWTDARSGLFTSLYAERVLPDGTFLDGGGIELATNVDSSEPVSISSNGKDFMVAWSVGATSTQQSTVRVARITAAGADLDPNGMVVAKNAYHGAVACNGVTYLVVWSLYQTSPSASPDVQAALVGSGGAASPAFGVSAAPARELWPHVVSNGREFLVVWQDSRAGGTDVYAARVSGDGVVLDPAGIAVAATADSEGWPTVGSNGRGFLVGWSIAGSTGTRILDAQVSSSGVAGSSHVLDSASASALPTPSVAWTGSTYVAVWQARVNAALRAAAVGADGASAATLDLPIPTSPGSYMGGSSFVLASGPGVTELAYARLATEPSYGGVPRIFMRTVTSS